MTCDRGFKKALEKADIPVDSWHELAQDHPTWRSTIKENLRPFYIRTELLCDPGHLNTSVPSLYSMCEYAVKDRERLSPCMSKLDFISGTWSVVWTAQE